MEKIKTHTLKTWSEFFREIWHGNKTWELRKNDKDYKPDDLLILEEGDIVHDDFVRTGRKVIAIVSYVLKDQPQFGLQKGYCIMTIKVIHKHE